MSGGEVMARVGCGVEFGMNLSEGEVMGLLKWCIRYREAENHLRTLSCLIFDVCHDGF